MKIKFYLSIIVCVVALCNCSDKDQGVEFGTDSDKITLGPDGGKQTINIASSGSWIATSNEPWITISPANGRGSVNCQILIDSALTDKPRQGIVRIQNQQSWDNKEIVVNQGGFDYEISLETQDVAIKNYAAYGTRYFDVTVFTNVDFDIKVPTSAENWLRYEKPKIEFDREVRPRNVTIRFNWTINSQPNERQATVTFKPKSEVSLTRCDELSVTQNAAEPIPVGTRKGDSIALLAVARSLGIWGEDWEASGEKMENWYNVQLWEEGMPGFTKDNEGRVRLAVFHLISTKEGIPFEVQYLTAAEELRFQSNSNTFQLSLETGPYITQLTKLKRLSIIAYGLNKLDPNFANLRELESLDLTGNNFQSVPEEINPTNFPKLRSLDMRTNQRRSIYDFSNSVVTDFGGLYGDGKFPTRLLEWNLDTLRLSANYIHGSFPTFEEDKYPKYTEADIANSYDPKFGRDTLPRQLLGKAKIMPHSGALSINLNRLTGDLPEWLLYHPMLNYWDAYGLIFSQEGKTIDGKVAKFNNVPMTLDYYYNAYPTKKRPSDKPEDEE